MPKTLETLNKRFAAVAETYADRPALSSKPHKSKEWATLTYGEVADQVRRVALGLRARGVEKGDRVALLSENRPEWAIADLAILAAGAVTVPIYPTLPPGQVAHILADSSAKAVIVSDAKQLQKVTAGAFPNLSVIVTMDESSAKDDAISFDALMTNGDTAQLSESFEVRRDAVSPDDLMTIIYTSGTTGNPKGVMLTHANMIATLSDARVAFPKFSPPDCTFLSFLPLCHIFERVLSFLALTNGARTFYNDSIFKLMDNFAEAKPDIMVCVPRVYESIHERVLETVGKSDAKKQKLFAWAQKIGEFVSEQSNAGKGIGPLTLLKWTLADALVLSKLRTRFGGKLKFFVSGGAPLNPTTARFFLSIGIPILEVWGLTEVGLATFNPLGRIKVGTVGKPSAQMQIRTADDSELLLKGPSVMSGYFGHPDATAESIDAHGWFHTGDIGEIDAQGYVKITDRKKDLLVLANGKKVAPQPIETTLKHSPLLSEVVLLGDGSGTVGALVVPNFDKLKAWAKEQGKEKSDNAALVADSDAKKLVKREIDSLSKDLADYEKIKRVALIDHAFSIENGELTPTLKVKRKVVAEKYGSLLEKE